MGNKHAVEVTPQERADLVARARDLAVEFDRLGRQADEENLFPSELVPMYKDSGLPRLVIPKKYGGFGADVWTTALVEKELASYGDPGITLSFNMHHVMVGIFRNLLDEPARERLFRRIVETGDMLSGTLSEERAGISGLSDTTAVPDGNGGWTVNGKKNWATYVENADIIAFTAVITNDDGSLPDTFSEHADREAVFVIPAASAGLKIDRTWDTMSMRASGTQTLIFDNVSVPGEAYSGSYRNGLFGEIEWACFPFAGVYLGVGDRALRLATETLAKKNLGRTQEGEQKAVRDVGYVQYELGKALTELQAAEWAVRGTAEALFEGADASWNPHERPARVAIGKVAATEAAIRATDVALRLVGGSAIRRGLPLERVFRDARAGIYHPVNSGQTYDMIGRAALGFFG
ncbi:acyl-CoA dehydrogenase family protein [Rhodococcus sp. D-6]|uniref:Acyl-CoA dehydrogenase family protein n=2 Tax=Rhodococcus TaxID=1827 RepID=A0AAU7UW55_9NOCA